MIKLLNSIKNPVYIPNNKIIYIECLAVNNAGIPLEPKMLRITLGFSLHIFVEDTMQNRQLLKIDLQ